MYQYGFDTYFKLCVQFTINWYNRILQDQIMGVTGGR